ncbi:MAG TPA: hypothetical protein VFL62_16810 [Bradyrhizobium sp.]|uniref:hypothetical protein n=1 Tax=Bradyrhizobium sp. TaxID=376 RepID=UPI002D810B06|nr:hypothetical protein [Bradyrhizobium sp.]HET7887885.1 hypothetical protein [Bradyrhizobium sp.]
MTSKETRSLRGRPLLTTRFAVVLLATTALGGALAYADDDDRGRNDGREFTFFTPGNLLVSKAVYDASPSSIVAGVTQLPPGCGAANSPCATANTDATYPFVFNNALVDGTFSVAAKVVLDELRADGDGDFVQSVEVPNSTQRGIKANSDQAVTSFESKSELAINLSVDHRAVSFLGYFAPVAALDVSNSNTPFVVDPTNADTQTVYRVFADVDQLGRFRFTKTNAYSGDNGRAAILNDANGADVHYGAGNAGSGSGTEPVGIIEGGGAQIEVASHLPLSQQVDPGAPTPLGSFNVTELGLKIDKVGKDTNFRGLTVFNNVVYFTKGSGGNGVNTVYFVDTTGNATNGNPNACPNQTATGGLPSPSATLPTTPINISNAATVQTQGVKPFNMCILNGFPTSLAKTTPTPMFPFGIWFANATTLYVADEGNGTATFDPNTNTYTAAAGQTTAGLQKWVFANGAWSLKYTLQAGLNLGVPYTVKNYPTGNNAATGQPWSPATDGLRNLTGRVNRDGTATIWAVTSTVSGSADQGADPNKLVAITDKLSATTLPAGESFKTVRTAKSGEVLRGVSFTPGTGLDLRQEVGSLLCDIGVCPPQH